MGFSCFKLVFSPRNCGTVVSRKFSRREMREEATSVRSASRESARKNACRRFRKSMPRRFPRRLLRQNAVFGGQLQARKFMPEKSDRGETVLY
jgi:hypothetical protein